MLNIISSIVLGWPAIVVTVILIVIGLRKTDYRYLVAAAVVAVPFSWALSGFPIVRSPIFLVPVLIFGSAWATHRGRDMVAWLFAIPVFLFVILLLFALSAGAS
jgi:hypothetical protein